MENPLNFLKKKYNLHNSPEVKNTVYRSEFRTGEKVTQKPLDQIQVYLDRFKEILDRENDQDRQQGIDALKRILYKNFVIKPENIPDGYYANQARLAREQGHGDVEISPEQKQQLAEVIIADQKSSLDTWVDYLASSDATYPDWLKYFAIRNVVTMGAYDKEKKQFTSRNKETTKPFPDLNREALAYVLDALEKKITIQKSEKDRSVNNEKTDFEKVLETENFAKLYAWAIDKLTPASAEQLAITKGAWIKYDQGSDHMPLVQSLQGHGTGWCTAGESTAKNQLQNGDFYVYYSETSEGDLEIPRAAIRMQGDRIAEVRGIAEQQNLDPFIAPIVQEKMKEFPDGTSYEKKSEDMKKLTSIENKVKLGQELNQSDLTFLYEINGTIQGFGYQKDPRIAEILSNRDTQSDVELLYNVDFNNIGKKELECIYGLLKTPVQFQTIQKSLREVRNVDEDLPIIFNCTPYQIATSIEQVNENTVAYIGPWSPDIMHHIPDTVEHLYESFPDKKIFRKTIELTSKTPEQYEQSITALGYTISDYAKYMMQQMPVVPESEPINLVSFTVEQLGFSGGATYAEIKEKAQQLGLKLCPPQVGPELRLQYTDQPNGEYLLIAMDPMPVAGGYLALFYVNQLDSVSRLSNSYGYLDHKWNSNDRFVFQSRK